MIISDKYWTSIICRYLQKEWENLGVYSLEKGGRKKLLAGYG
jgi:hypothetical protein